MLSYSSNKANVFTRGHAIAEILRLVPEGEAPGIVKLASLQPVELTLRRRRYIRNDRPSVTTKNRKKGKKKREMITRVSTASGSFHDTQCRRHLRANFVAGLTAACAGNWFADHNE